MTDKEKILERLTIAGKYFIRNIVNKIFKVYIKDIIKNNDFYVIKCTMGTFNIYFSKENGLNIDYTDILDNTNKITDERYEEFKKELLTDFSTTTFKTFNNYEIKRIVEKEGFAYTLQYFLGREILSTDKKLQNLWHEAFDRLLELEEYMKKI